MYYHRKDKGFNLDPRLLINIQYQHEGVMILILN